MSEVKKDNAQDAVKQLATYKGGQFAELKTALAAVRARLNTLTALARSRREALAVREAELKAAEEREAEAAELAAKAAKLAETLTEPEPAPEPPQPKELHLEGKRILLAEDNEINMEITTELLSLHGIHITQAWNGREALEAFRQSEPFWFDAILMDMQMPEMDGCQAAQAIRRLDRPDAAKVPIIAVTANAFSEDLAATTAAGMNAHISKPIDFQLFRQTLERFLLPPQDSSPKKS